MTYLRQTSLRLLFVLLTLGLFTPTAQPLPFYQSLSHAQHALDYERPSQALLALEQALAFEPASQGLHKPAFDIAFNLGLWEQAETHLLALQAHDPSSVDTACARLKLQLAHAEVTPSTPDNVLLTSDCPGVVALLGQLASDYFKAGNFMEAVPLLQSQVALEPENSHAQAMLALYAAATEPEYATDKLREAQASSDHYARLALELLLLIQDSLAKETPAYTYAQVGQAFARTKEWHLAQEAFKQAVQLDPEYAQAWGYLGVIKDSVGADGENELLEAVRLAPEDPVFLIMQADHYNRRGEYSKALSMLEQAAALDENNPAIAVALGETYTNLGDFERARMAYRQSTLLSPDEPLFWQLLADFSLRFELDIAALGLPAARNAVILAPGSSQGWRALGYGHFLLANFSLSERALQRAVDIEPSDPIVQYYLGLLFQSQGQIDNALSAWVMASRLAPDHPYARLAQRALDALIIHR